MSIVCEIALFLEISEERIRKGFEDVSCEKYRLQVIYNDLNTIIINDAKSTNQAASLAAIESLKDIEYDIHWILGGHGSTNDLISNTNSYIKKYYLYGENKDELEKDLQEYHNEYSKYNFLEEVIENIKNDNSKKIILYSPAAQSYDQYDNFEQRGEHFNSLINKYWHN
jgi:UDP-N-acetylmuramoylalanine--D-glutamate ligase